MAFGRETNITKDSVQDFSINLFVPGPDNPDGTQAAQVEVQIKLSDGTVAIRTFDLLARLNDDAAGLTHLANLALLRDYIRARLNSEVLPP